MADPELLQPPDGAGCGVRSADAALDGRQAHVFDHRQVLKRQWNWNTIPTRPPGTRDAPASALDLTAARPSGSSSATARGSSSFPIPESHERRDLTAANVKPDAFEDLARGSQEAEIADRHTPLMTKWRLPTRLSTRAAFASGRDIARYSAAQSAPGSTSSPCWWRRSVFAWSIPSPSAPTPGTSPSTSPKVICHGRQRQPQRLGTAHEPQRLTPAKPSTCAASNCPRGIDSSAAR